MMTNGIDFQINTNGVTRIVLLIGNVAVKIPNIRQWRLFLRGLLGNMQERLFGTSWMQGFCPIVCSDPFGFVVVMRRAIPLSDKEWAEFDYEKFVNRADYKIPVENKQDSFGWVGSQIVAIDYGS